MSLDGLAAAPQGRERIESSSSHGGRSAANPIHNGSIAPGSWAPAREQTGGMGRFGIGGRDGFQGSGACPFDKVCAAHRRGSGPSKRKRCRRQDNQGREDHSMKPAPTSLDGGSGDFDLEALGGAIVLPPNFHELVARRQLWICAHRQNTHFLRWS